MVLDETGQAIGGFQSIGLTVTDEKSQVDARAEIGSGRGEQHDTTRFVTIQHPQQLRQFA